MIQWTVGRWLLTSAARVGVEDLEAPLAGAVFVDTTNFDNDKPLEFFFNALEDFGNAAVPLNMLVLGGSLASIPTFAAVHWPSTLAVVCVKLLVYPAVVFSFLIALSSAGYIQKMVPGHPMHVQLCLVASLVSATPTANNLSVMAEVGGGPRCKQAVAAMIFAQYCAAPFLLTMWIAIYVKVFPGY